MILHNIFRKKGKIDTRLHRDNRCQIVLTNSYRDICYVACKECYKGKLVSDIEAKNRYIQGKVKLGHESIIEHSNVVMMLNLNTDLLQDLAYMLSYNRFLTCDIEMRDDEIVLLIGGSILGFKQLIRRIPELSNNVLRLIIGCLYELDPSFFYDLIEDEIMDANSFVPTEVPECNKVESEYDKVEYIHMDNINQLYENTNHIFSYKRLLKFISITVYFKEVSRIISQQITRHRNAISQKSQRYVDEGEAKFLSPVQFRENKSELKINWAGEEWNSQELGEFMVTAYNSCKEAGMLKEEARSYLPNNVASSLFMTFKGDTFVHFIKMRNDSHAQSEVRYFGKEFERMFNKHILPYMNDVIDCRELIEPLYKSKQENFSNIDEVIED